MKIEIQELLPKLEESSFVVKPNQIAGKKVYLIHPQDMGVTWTAENLIFRSSIWSEDGLPVSLGFRKFFNLTEQPDLIPDPENLHNVKIREKIDGSCLIVSCFNGELIARTRGTIDAKNLDNGFEIDELKKKYPKAFANNFIAKGDYSLIFEWVSPLNVIVLRYGDEPDMYLTGAIKHEDYSYATQDELEKIGQAIEVKTTPFYTFNSWIEMLATVEHFKGKEGICIYYNHGQDIKKVKGLEYLSLHAFKSAISLKNCVEMFLQFGKPDYNAFLDRIEKDFDFECRNMAIPLVSKVCDAHEEAKKIIEGIKQFIKPLFSLPRKEAAEKVFASYGKTIRSSCAFKLLDGKEIEDKMMKTLIFQKLGES